MPPIYWFLIGLIAAAVLLQIQFATLHKRPLFLMLGLVFIVYFVIPGMTISTYRNDYAYFFWADEWAIVRGAAYIFGVVVLMWIGYARPIHPFRRVAEPV